MWRVSIFNEKPLLLSIQDLGRLHFFFLFNQGVFALPGETIFFHVLNRDFNHID